MPIRLKSLELHGYKTFASRTHFEFSGGITAIVGPNGSGKSNIADALRWVLGEQSYSLLRGKKTEDMIFSGSENRPRAGMASAAIIFDNADNWLPVDFSEVELARHAYRDGRNDYLLNNQHVRLRDINELLAQSGLSERTYTILGQGLVDASLALKADERRRLFEEAAGIGLYRSRREEALRRMDTTQRNLDRVLDILAELGPRLKSLEKQATRSREYLQVQADLRKSLREWYGYHWHHYQQEMNHSRSLSVAQEEKLASNRKSHQEIRQEFLEFREKLQNIRSRLNSWHHESARLHSTRESISREMAVLEERRRALVDNQQYALLEKNRLEIDFSSAKERLIETEKETQQIQNECEDASSQLNSIEETLKVKQIERSKVEKFIENINFNILASQTRRVESTTRKDEILSRIESQKKKLNEINESISMVEDEVAKAKVFLVKSVKEREEGESNLNLLEKNMSESRMKILNLDTEKKRSIDEKTKLMNEVTRLKVQLDVLDQAEQSLAGFADGARLILDASRKSKLNSDIKALSSLLDVPAELELAIAAALGEFIDSVILNSNDDLEKIINLLENAQTGRATLLYTDRLKPQQDLSAPKDDACLGVACDMIKIIPEYRSIVDYLLGRVLIVTDRHQARRIIVDIQKDIKVVTLAGEVFYPTGPVQAGKQTNASALSRTRQKREYREGILQLEKQIEKITSVIQNIEIDLKVLNETYNHQDILFQQDNLVLEERKLTERKTRDELETAKRNFNWQISQRENLQKEIEIANDNIQNINQIVIRIDVELDEFQNTIRSQTTLLKELNLGDLIEQVTYWNTQLAVGLRAQSDAQNRLKERSQILSQIENQINQLNNKLMDFDNSISSLDNEKILQRGHEMEFNEQLEALRVLIEPAESDLENAEKHEMDLQKQEMKSQQALASVERFYNQAQLEFGKKQEAVENLRQKIEDDFGLVSLEYATNVDGPVPLPLDGMVEQLVSIDILSPDLEETLSRQRMILRRMGPINPEAQQEFESVSERHGFLESQLDDLRKAEVDLRQVISELDDLTRQEFLKTFSAVAIEFKTIFHRLFGGGSAKLLLTDPDNLTETGIDIEARLPGKREQGLALLSGGERSLTAIALVFSLLKVSPTPVCVMDEVDAMLDEANVGRFRDLVRELSQETQFIIITHNRNTVQAADVIYGVTMGRDSVSQIISLKLDEVSDDILKGRGD